MPGCKKCGKCCVYFVFEPWQFKHDMEWLDIQGGRMSGKFALIPAPCPKLKDGECTIHEARPPFCRDWPGAYEDCNHEWLKALGCRFFEEG